MTDHQRHSNHKEDVLDLNDTNHFNQTDFFREDLGNASRQSYGLDGHYTSQCLRITEESGPSLVIMDHDNSSKEENGHQFAVRFFPRARHKPNLATRDKKHVREVAVVKPHDLTTVRNFLVDMILREQKFQQKTLVCSYI
ncbi:hypothetical protein Y032_0044g1010 [Ancylostoma ceylanicum]|nr:hypothetical protein Y032_0044g1010 [Ancylostoma ceylanicum]